MFAKSTTSPPNTSAATFVKAAVNVVLPDNQRQAMGPQSEINRYKRVLGVGAQNSIEVLV